MNKARQALQDEMDKLRDQMAALDAEASELRGQISAIFEKKRQITCRGLELSAIAMAHDKDDIDIVRAKLSGEFARPIGEITPEQQLSTTPHIKPMKVNMKRGPDLFI